MSTRESGAVGHSTVYNIFILVLTVMSLAIMVLLLLPINSETKQLLLFYDNAACFIFLADFAFNMAHARPRRAYFFGQRGWLDLLGSVPSLGILKATALLRLARISRLARVGRLLSGKNRDALVKDVIENRAQYAAFITVLLGFLVLVTASIVVLNAESRSSHANIDTGWNAFWWAFVTITTVGYGDYYPVTVVGRIAAMFVMVMGIGIIGALASILASVLVGDSASNEASAAPQETTALQGELEAVRSELATLRALVERIDVRLAG